MTYLGPLQILTPFERKLKPVAFIRSNGKCAHAIIFTFGKHLQNTGIFKINKINKKQLPHHNPGL